MHQSNNPRRSTVQMNRRRSIRASIKLSDFRVANDNIRATNASRLQEHSFSPAPLSPVGEKNEDPFAGLLDDEIEFLKFYIFRWAQHQTDAQKQAAWRTWSGNVRALRRCEAEEMRRTTTQLVQGVLQSSRVNGRSPKEVEALRQYFLAHKLIFRAEPPGPPAPYAAAVAAAAAAAVGGAAGARAAAEAEAAAAAAAAAAAGAVRRRSWAGRASLVGEAVDDRAVTRMCQKAELCELAEGDLLQLQGEPGDALYVLVQGRVNLHQVDTPEQLAQLAREVRVLRQLGAAPTLERLKPHLGRMFFQQGAGSTLGAPALLLQAPHAMSAAAASTPARLLRLDRHIFNVALRAHLDARLQLRPKLAFLRRLKHLEHWPEFRLQRLALALAEERFPAGTDLLTEGAAFDSVFLVAQGEVALRRRVKVGDRRRRVNPALKRQPQLESAEVLVLRRGGAAGQLEVERHRDRAAFTARAVGPLVAYRLGAPQFQNFFYQACDETTKIVQAQTRKMETEIKERVKAFQRGETTKTRSLAALAKAGVPLGGGGGAGGGKKTTKGKKGDAFEAAATAPPGGGEAAAAGGGGGGGRGRSRSRGSLTRLGATPDEEHSAGGSDSDEDLEALDRYFAAVEAEGGLQPGGGGGGRGRAGSLEGSVGTAGTYGVWDLASLDPGSLETLSMAAPEVLSSRAALAARRAAAAAAAQQAPPTARSGSFPELLLRRQQGGGGSGGGDSVASLGEESEDSGGPAPHAAATAAVAPLPLGLLEHGGVGAAAAAGGKGPDRSTVLMRMASDVSVASFCSPRDTDRSRGIDLSPVQPISTVKNRFEASKKKNEARKTFAVGIKGPLFDLAAPNKSPKSLKKAVSVGGSPSLPKIPQASPREPVTRDITYTAEIKPDFYAVNPLYPSPIRFKPSIVKKHSAPHSGAVYAAPYAVVDGDEDAGLWGPEWGEEGAPPPPPPAGPAGPRGGGGVSYKVLLSRSGLGAGGGGGARPPASTGALGGASPRRGTGTTYRNVRIQLAGSAAVAGAGTAPSLSLGGGGGSGRALMGSFSGAAGGGGNSFVGGVAGNQVAGNRAGAGAGGGPPGASSPARGLSNVSLQSADNSAATSALLLEYRRVVGQPAGAAASN